MIVVIADSSTTSLMPAGSVLPTGDCGSIRISMCRPWLTSSTDQLGAPSSPVYPTNFSGLASPVDSAPKATCSWPSTMLKPVASAHEPDASGTALVEEVACVGDHFVAAHLVVAASPFPRHRFPG